MPRSLPHPTVPPRLVTVTVPPEADGERLDRWLASVIPDLSRARLQALIRDGHVRSGATIGEAKKRVKPGDVLTVSVPEAEAADVAGEQIALSVVYEDDDVIVIDKPAGLVVHPAAGHASGTLVNALIAHCGATLSGIGGVRRPGIVHRLDKDTSGLLVVAKNDAAHVSLSEQFKSHGEDGRLERAYLALVWGALDRPKGTIDAPLARSNANRTRISVTRKPGSRHAVTHYQVLEVFVGATPAATISLLRLQLETGRTHQIRVHLAHISHPVLGDPVYGAGFKTREAALDGPLQAVVERLERQALHAALLAFEHPASGEAMSFESPIPADIADIIAVLRAPAHAPLAAANKAKPNSTAKKSTAKKATAKKATAKPAVKR